MKTVLVPVDFTSTTLNAARFAAAWAAPYEYTRIILLKSFFHSIFDDVAVAAEYVHVDKDYRLREREDAREKLRELCDEIANTAGSRVKVITATSEAPLLRAIIELIEQERVDTVLVASDHHRYSSESFVAGNLIAIAKASPARVLVVPSGFEYRPVKKILLPCNSQILQSLERLRSLREVPQWSQARIEVLYVDAKEKPTERIQLPFGKPWSNISSITTSKCMFPQKRVLSTGLKRLPEQTL